MLRYSSGSSGGGREALTANSDIAHALRRFFSYHSALPPEEYVSDFFGLIQPGRLLHVGQGWLRECGTPEAIGAQTIAELAASVEMLSPARRADLAALAAYALAKTGSVARTAARPVGERLVALLIGHVRALQLGAAAIQRDDASHLARLTAAFVGAWPDFKVSLDRDAILQILTRPGPVAPRPRFLADPVPASGYPTLDIFFHSLASNGLTVEEPLALLIALLRPEPRTPSRFWGRRGHAPLVRLKALGYDDRSRVGFAAELTVDRWAGSHRETRLIRHPDSLFVVTDEAFDQALAFASQLAEKSGRDTPSPAPGRVLRWSLRRDSLSPDGLFFASGGSIAGAFAVALRLIQEGSAWFQPMLHCAVVATVAEDGALRGVDGSTLKEKVESAATERIILSADQPTESGWLLRHRRHIRTAASVEEAVRQCLRLMASTVLRQYRIGLSTTILLLTLTSLTAIHFTQLWHADKRTEFDASEQFSTTMNPAPYSPWQYGWISAGEIPNTRQLMRFRRHTVGSGNQAWLKDCHFWSPPDADSPNVSYLNWDVDIPWPAANVLWPSHAISFQPDQMGDFSCVRFIVPRDGRYRINVTYWGSSLINYGATLYLLEDNNLICTRSATKHSSIRRKDAISFDSNRGETQTIVNTANLRQGQTIDVVVGAPVEDSPNTSEHATGLLFHVSRLP